MAIVYVAATPFGQRKVFDGHGLWLLTLGSDRHGRLSHSFFIRKINLLWQLIYLNMIFSIRSVNYLLVRRWESRSSWVNMIANGGRE